MTRLGEIIEKELRVNLKDMTREDRNAAIAKAMEAYLAKRRDRETT